MFSSSASLRSVIGDFRIGSMLRYSMFVPRLDNLCEPADFEAGMIMPSHAFCSDEGQGYPIILVTRHRVLSQYRNFAPGGAAVPADQAHSPAAGIPYGKGGHRAPGPAEITARLMAQDTGNPEQNDREDAIHKLEDERETGSRSRPVGLPSRQR